MAEKKSMSGDLFELLKNDHNRLMNMFSEMIEQGEDQRADLFSQVKEGLDRHMRFEEEFFYPVLEQESDAREMALEAEEEHHVSKTVVNELSSMSVSDEHWMAKAKVLKELVSHHIQEEEEELFQAAKDLLDQEQIQDIGSKVEQYIK